MQVQKSLKIAVHYDTTKSKINILDNLTARITYCIKRISKLINDETKIDRPTMRKLVKENDIVSKTGLSAGFIDQCIDKIIWAWKSHNKRHKKWEEKVKKAKREKSLQKLLEREPSKPDFQKKTPCRFDYRTGNVEFGKGKFSPLWIHISTLEKRKKIDVPLNPSQYHLNLLANAEINDFEIVKKGNKYYVHVSTTRVVEDKPFVIG